MKNSQKRSAWLIQELLVGAALLLAAGCATEAPLAHDGVLSAKVVRLKGAARYSTGNNIWQSLKVGDRVKPCTVIQTAEDSSMDLVLGAELPSYEPGAGQNTVRIWGNSLLAIDKLTMLKTGADITTETELDLKAGHIHGVVKKLTAASKYEVRIPNGVAGVRGTVYDIWATGEIKVLLGSVVLAYVGPDGTVVTQVIMGSQQFGAPTGVHPPPESLGTRPPVSRPF
jgi:hypothetical protein